MTSLAHRVRLALDEDLGPGDLTTEATIPAGGVCSAQIIAKQHVVVSGHAAGRAAFAAAAERMGGVVVYKDLVPDGATAAPGTPIASLHGAPRAVLVGERLALNLMMRMTGIATHVRGVVDAVGPATFRLVDTRKTTPLWRDLEKAAVVHGGAASHRFGLFDGVLIKDNHIAAVGSVAEAVGRAREASHHLVRVEVEVSDLDGLAAALQAGADAVLLDNMSDDAMAAALAQVQQHPKPVLVEASGNMTVDRLKAIAGLGLDLVSMGGLIHQARWADLSLKLD